MAWFLKKETTAVVGDEIINQRETLYRNESWSAVKNALDAAKADSGEGRTVVLWMEEG